MMLSISSSSIVQHLEFGFHLA